MLFVHAQADFGILNGDKKKSGFLQRRKEKKARKKQEKENRKRARGDASSNESGKDKNCVIS